MSIGKNISFYCNGVNLAGALQSFEPTTEIEELDASVLATDYRSYEPGFKGGALSGSGVFQYDPILQNKLHDLMSAAFNNRTDLIVTASLEQVAAGGAAIMMLGLAKSYGIDVAVNQLLLSNFNLTSSRGLQFGRWLFNGTATGGGASVGASVNTGAPHTGGYTVHVHNLAGDGNASVMIQHSSNNSTWVDLLGAPVVVGVKAAAEIKGASGVTVNQFVRAVVTPVGTNCTVAAAIEVK